MKRLFSARALVAAAVALGAVGAASVAQARSDVSFAIGVNVPYGYVEPAPVYVQPQPVYVQPRPVYVQPQVGYYGQDFYYERGWEHRHRRHERRYGPWGDADRDGVPNRYDRDPYNPYRR